MDVLRLSAFDPYAELKDFVARQSGAGAVASLIGLCRAESGRVKTLVLDHFPGFTETEKSLFSRPRSFTIRNFR